MPTSAVGIVTCNSEKYIQEVICHNYLVGFDKIIICLDQCDDDTPGAIQKLPDKVLEKVDVFFNSPHRDDVGFQHRGYQTIYDKYKGKVEWLAMFDDDEYFYDKRKRQINTMLAAIPGDVGQICLPWLVFTHNKQVLSAPLEITRLKYFTHKDTRPLGEFKSIVRLSNIITNDIPSSWYHIRHADVNGRSIMFDGNNCQQEGNILRLNNVKSEHLDTCLVHYMHGSMEDFVIRHRKWKRERIAMRQSNWNTFDSFVSSNVGIEDLRMSLYADELIKLLGQCKN